MAPTEIPYSHKKMLQFRIYSKLDNWFCLGHTSPGQTVKISPVSRVIKNYC